LQLCSRPATEESFQEQKILKVLQMKTSIQIMMIFACRS
jgi:hypothetical protein